MPQAKLQQTSPTLQVFEPHAMLAGATLMPQTSCEHFCPGSVQVPQLALQHTLPAEQTTWPHGSPPGSAAEFRAVTFDGAFESVPASPPVSPVPAPTAMGAETSAPGVDASPGCIASVSPASTVTELEFGGNRFTTAGTAGSWVGLPGRLRLGDADLALSGVGSGDSTAPGSIHPCVSWPTFRPSF